MRAILSLILAIAFLGWIPYSAYGTVETIETTIQSKERINDGFTSKYLIFTEKEVFQNSDTWAFLKFNSSDVYGKLKEGATCQLKVNGFRVPFFSMYRNIISATC